MMTDAAPKPDTFHFHVCENCLHVMGHNSKSPEPRSYHDCPKCGEEVDRNGFVRRYDVAQRVSCGFNRQGTDR